MSLLNFDDPQQAGLLAFAQNMFAAGAPQTRRVGIGQALTSGLSGMQQAQQAAELAKRQKQQEEMMMQMKQMQLGQFQQQMKDSEAAKRQAAMLPELLQKFGNDYQGMIRAGIPADLVKSLAESQNYGKQKVARTQEIQGNNGEKLLRSFSDFNEVIGEDQRGYVAPQMVNRGNRIDMVTPMAGQSFSVGMSPAEQATAFRSDRAYNQAERQFASNQDMKLQELGVKQAEKLEAKNQAVSGQVASIDTMLDSLDRIKTHPGLKNSVGFMSVTPTMPGSNSANFQAELETFQSQAFIPMVSQLKGMGALSDAEGKKLTAAVGALNPRMSETAFKNSLDRIKKDIEAARKRAIQGTTLPPRSQTSGTDIESLLKQYGG
jgi:hypothetical protein